MWNVRLTVQQVINVSDISEPVFANIPADETVECDAIPAPATPTVTDDCDTDVEIAFEEIQEAGRCEDSYVILRSWTATDDCGNSTQATQVINVDDTTDPILDGIPADITVDASAGETTPNPATPTATDNCDTDVEIVLTETSSTTDGCGTALVRTWTATDNCGNTTSANQTIIIIDGFEPAINPTNSTICLGTTTEFSVSPAR